MSQLANQIHCYITLSVKGMYWPFQVHTAFAAFRIAHSFLSGYLHKQLSQKRLFQKRFHIFLLPVCLRQYLYQKKINLVSKCMQ